MDMVEMSRALCNMTTELQGAMDREKAVFEILKKLFENELCFLKTHNKNLTKKQYYNICEVCDEIERVINILE